MTFRGLQTRLRWYLVNSVYAGTAHFEKKRKILLRMGHEIGEGTKIVGPVYCTGRMVIGRDCWIGRNMRSAAMRASLSVIAVISRRM